MEQLVDAVFLARGLAISHKIKHKPTWEWTVPVLGFYLRKMKKTYTYTKTYKRIFIAVFIHKNKDWDVGGEPTIAYSPIHQLGNEFD